MEKALVQRKGQITEPAFQSRHLRPLILRGTKYADTIKGRAGDDVIRGLGGADWMRGDEGVDELYGEGNDTLVSGSGGNLFKDLVDCGLSKRDKATVDAKDEVVNCEDVTVV